MKTQFTIGSTNDPQEQQADQTADHIMRMPESPFVQRKCASCEHEKEKIIRKTEPFIQKQGNGLEGGLASESVTNQIESSRGGGSRMSENTLSFMESRFNTDFSGVKIHTDSNAVQMSRELNAQAFTVGSDIYFNEGKYNPESASGKHLLAHELTHTVQQSMGIDRKIQMRSATWLERRSWLSFFSHYIPRMFLNNYMDDTGNPITLTRQQMIDCNPVISIARSEDFRTQLSSLRSSGGGTRHITVTGYGGALTNGSLGNFTVNYDGNLIVNPDGTWNFNGTMTFYDYWDFDPKPFEGNGRSFWGEVKTRVAAATLPGSPFHIYSERVPVRQNSTQVAISWGAGTPTPVGDHMVRSGVDISAGTVGTGPIIGPEIGANASEDLN